MARVGVNPIRLEEALVEELRKYTKDIQEEVNKQAKKTGTLAKERLKSQDLGGAYKNRRPRYRKGWATKTEKHGDVETTIIHNKTDYQLTHLLEHGHAIAGGTGRTRAFPHIAPAEKYAAEKFTENVEKAIKGYKGE